MINIIYDIGVIGDCNKAESKTGIYRVVDELFKQLIKNENINLFFSHIGNNASLNYSIDYLKENKLEHKLLTKEKKKITFLPFRKEKPFRFLYRKLGIEIGISLSHDYETINTFHIFHSPFLAIPKKFKKIESLKRIITIYDLIPLIYNNLHFMEKEIKFIIKSIENDYIICISEHTKKDLLNYAPNLNPNNIFVVHLAASKKIFYQCLDKSKYSIIKEKYNLPDNYFLSLSTLEPRKNIAHVIRTFIKFIKEYNVNDIGLVLVGTKGWMYDEIFKEYENANELKSKIIITGRVPDEDLATIYSNAHSFYYMSLYEGFGLPPLEAMQCGIATVTSNTSSLPEVVGDGGIMLEPNDSESLCNTMWKLYSDESLRKEYCLKGIEQSKLFSWEKCAIEHINIYSKINNT